MKQQKPLYDLNAIARDIIKDAVKRERSRGYVSRFYGIPPTIIEAYLDGAECGTLRAREVIRVEISRIKALKDGNYDFFPEDKDRYKGTRGL